jgi:hypothetical protein
MAKYFNPLAEEIFALKTRAMTTHDSRERWILKRESTKRAVIIDRAYSGTALAEERSLRSPNWETRYTARTVISTSFPGLGRPPRTG